ncbi:FACT complex subunit SSRP1, partial [Trichinella papuae]
LPEDILKEKYNGELPRQLSGPLFEIISRIMKCLVRKQITVPGNFVGHTGTPAVGCAYKSAGGFLYPLQHGFLYVHKPPVYVRLEEISCINFARSHVTTKSFDFEIQTKQGNIFTFTSIMKEEYGKLYDFVVSKNINITNTGKRLETTTTENLFKGSSDEEGERDHYAEQLKSEAREKEENNENDSDETEDSDYDPEKGEVRKNSSESSSSSSDSEASGGSEDEPSDQEKKNKQKMKNVMKKAKTKSSSSAESEEEKDDDDNDDDDDDEEEEEEEKLEEEEEEDDDDKKPKLKKAHKKKAVQQPKSKKQKKVKEGPKRNITAYMFYVMENRSKFKKPGMSFADVSKAAAEQWKKLKDKSKWENLAAVDRRRYMDEMKEFKKKGGNIVATKNNKSSKSSTPVKASKIKSREIIEDSDSSSDEKMDTTEASSDE